MNLFRWIKQFIAPPSEDPIAAFERSLAVARAELLENLDPVPAEVLPTLAKIEQDMLRTLEPPGEGSVTVLYTTRTGGEAAPPPPIPAVPPWPLFRTCLDCGCPWVWHSNHVIPRRCAGHRCECQTMQSQAERFTAEEVPPQ